MNAAPSIAAALPGRNCWVSVEEPGRQQGRHSSNPRALGALLGAARRSWQQHGRALLWIIPVIWDIPSERQCLGKPVERNSLLQHKGFAALHRLLWSQKYPALGLSAWDNWPWHCSQLWAQNSWCSDLPWRTACNCTEYLLTVFFFNSWKLSTARTSRQKCSEEWKVFYVDEHMKRWLCIAKSLIPG